MITPLPRAQAKAKQKQKRVEGGRTGAASAAMDERAEQAMKAASAGGEGADPTALNATLESAFGLKSLSAMGYASTSDPSSFTSRIIAGTDKTLLDPDRKSEVRALDRNYHNKRSLGARLAKSVAEMVDPFAEDAMAEQKSKDAARAAKRAARKAANPDASDGDDDSDDDGVDANMSAEEAALQAARGLMSRLEQEVCKFIVRSVVADEVVRVFCADDVVA